MNEEQTMAFLEEHGDELAKLAFEDEKLGRLTDRTVEILKDSGILRMLQPKEYDGAELHPQKFVEAVMAVARRNGSAGWVSGVVGVHPWELALFGEPLMEEVWGENPDTLIASPFSPSGIAEPVEGGYLLSGRWQFSSGTDHCQWLFLGAMVGNGSNSGKPAMPPQVLHVVLPRADYEIVDDSWDVMGLSGTGSKDVIVDKAFIPSYRAKSTDTIMSGTAAESAGREDPLYKMPFTTAFPVGITASVIGIAQGALDLHNAIQRDRISVMGQPLRDDPYAAYFTAQAAADIEASRLQLLDGVNWAFDRLATGQEISFADRSRIRRNQVQAAWRAVSALDAIFARAGGNAIRKSSPLQRHWRDAHVGLQHMIHVPGTVFHANALTMMGLEPPVHLTLGI